MSKYPNSGTFQVNARKEKDTHPDFAGSGEIDGKPYWLNIWRKNGSNGEFFSISFKPKEPQARSANRAPPPADDGGFDDPLPF